MERLQSIVELVLLGLYLLLSLLSVYNRHWWVALYWVGATILTLAVVFGMRR